MHLLRKRKPNNNNNKVVYTAKFLKQTVEKSFHHYLKQYLDGMGKALLTRKKKLSISLEDLQYKDYQTLYPSLSFHILYLPGTVLNCTCALHNPAQLGKGFSK